MESHYLLPSSHLQNWRWPDGTRRPISSTGSTVTLLFGGGVIRLKRNPECVAQLRIFQYFGLFTGQLSYGSLASVWLSPFNCRMPPGPSPRRWNWHFLFNWCAVSFAKFTLFFSLISCPSFFRALL